MTMLVAAAHPDDEVLGVGGTIAKSSKEEEVVTVIFSYGQGWPFWGDKEDVILTRKKEVKKASRILGDTRTYFLDLEDGKIDEGFDNEKREKLRNIFERHKPDRVFYHSEFDGHGDHLAVNNIMNRFLQSSKFSGKTFKFEINLWNWFKYKPFIIYDITDTFEKKMRALEAFKSQWIWVKPLKYLMEAKAVYYGRQANCKYGESFYLI
jgi:LmbE family N-acetylglucosaminyl deacetylase